MNPDANGYIRDEEYDIHVSRYVQILKRMLWRIERAAAKRDKRKQRNLKKRGWKLK
jgi:hypothetical protein